MKTSFSSRLKTMLPSFSKSSLKIVLSFCLALWKWTVDVSGGHDAADQGYELNTIIYLGTGGAAISNAASPAGRLGLDSDCGLF